MAPSGDSCISELGSPDCIVPMSNELTAMLVSLNLHKYIGVFAANGIDDISTLSEMQDVHYQRLGVLLGHQLKIMKRLRFASDTQLVGSSESLVCQVASTAVLVPNEVYTDRLGNMDSGTPKNHRPNTVDALDVSESRDSEILSNSETSHCNPNVLPSKPDVTELNLDHAQAMYQRGQQFDNGEGVEQDKAQAAAWYRCSAELGEVRAMSHVGTCFLHGTGVSKDQAAAVVWYQRAADLGDADSMFNLGTCYDNGTGVVDNPDLAASWYQRAADLGNAKAMFNLGICYQEGTGVPQDNAKAASWYLLAADSGYAAAMYQMGCCFSRGFGVATDKVQALSWYQRAADEGNEQAILKLDSI